MKATGYVSLENFAETGNIADLGSETAFQTLLLEVKLIRKKMSVLPTVRESEALPELQLLQRVVAQLVANPLPAFHKALDANPQLQKLFYESLVEGVCGDVLRARVYSNKEIVKVADAIFASAVSYCARNLPAENPLLFSILHLILDKNAAYYVSNGREVNYQEFPFGEQLPPDQETLEWLAKLQVGDVVDCLKSLGSRKCWSRAVYEGAESNYYKVRFLNERNLSYINNIETELAPLGSRSADYEWREALKPGDTVDYFHYQSMWVLAHVESASYDENVFGDTSKTIIIRIESEKAKTDPVNDTVATANMAFADDVSSYMKSNEQKFTIKVHSPGLAQPGTRSGKVAVAINDSDDLKFLARVSAKKWAILRAEGLTKNNSIYFVKYLNCFGANGGFDFLVDVASGKRAVKQETSVALTQILQNVAEYLVAPFIQEHGKTLLTWLTDSIGQNIERNIRHLSSQNLANFMDAVTVFTKRALPEAEANRYSHDINVKVAIVCLRSEILEKQFFGAKKLIEIENNVKYADPHGLRPKLAQLLVDERIFEKILKGHPNLIEKGSGTLKILFTENRITEDQLTALWEQIRKADSESKCALLGMLKEISWEMDPTQIRFLLAQVMKNPEDPNTEFLEVITALRRVAHFRHKDDELVSLLNGLVWQLLSEPSADRPGIAKELIQTLITNISEASKASYFMKAVDNVLVGKSKDRNMKFLIKMLKSPGAITPEMAEVIKEKKVVEFCIDELRKNFLISGEDTSVPDTQQSEGSTASLPSRTTAAGQKSQAPISPKKILPFLTAISSSSAEKNALFRPQHPPLFFFSDFVKIWDIVFDNGIQHKGINDWMYDYLKTHQRVQELPLYKQFFETHLPRLTRPGSEEFFAFFMLLFLIINELDRSLIQHHIALENCVSSYKTSKKLVYLPQKPFEEVFGTELLWKTMMDATSPRLFGQIANFVSNISLQSEFCERIHPEIYQPQKQKQLKRSYDLFMEGNALGAQKAVIILTKIIRNEEMRSGFGLVSFAQVKEGERLRLTFEKEHSHLKQKTTIETAENQTVYQLREALAADNKVPFELVGIAFENGGDIPSTDNILTLERSEIKNLQAMIFKERETEIIDFQFMNDAKTDFSEMTRRAFLEVFQQFGSDGRMTREQFKRLQGVIGSNIYYEPKEQTEVLLFGKLEGGVEAQSKPATIGFDEFLDGFRRIAIIGGDRGVVQVKQNLYSLGFNKTMRPRRYPLDLSPEGLATSTRHMLANDKAFTARLLEYIKPSYVPQTDAEAGSDQSFESRESQEAADLFVRLLENLPPAYEDVVKAWEDPTGFLAGASDPFMVYHRSVIIQALLFRSDFLRFMVRIRPEVFGHGEAGFLARTLTPDTLVKVLKALRVASVSFDYKAWAAKLLSPMRLLERLLKTAVGFIDPEFNHSTKQLTSYVARRRIRANETGQAQSSTDAANAKPNSTTDLKTARAPKPASDDKDFEETRLLVFKSTVEAHDMFGTLKSSFNFAEINQTLLRFLEQFIPEMREIEMMHTRLLKSVATVFVCSIKLREAELTTLIASPDFARVMFKGLTSPSPICRLYFKNMYSIVASEAKSVEFKTDLLKILLTALGAKESEELHGVVEIACLILAEIGELKAKNPEIEKYLHSALNFSDLFRNLKKMLMEHESSEKQLNEEPDGMLVSYLAFLEQILKTDELVVSELTKEEKRELTTFIFKKCLFEVNAEGVCLDQVKCKSKRSRAIALELLKLLLKGDSSLNVLFLATCLNPLVKVMPPFAVQSQYTANPERKTKNGFAGIKNPGCVCYMIATLQQFYCTPAFRYGVLMANDNRNAQLVTYKGRTIDDNVFHQFQKMMAYLDMSDRKDYDPHDFCFSYKDYSGEPTNVSVQQDADEFLKVILERLENAFMGSPYLGVLNSVFLGKVCNVITCKGCGYEKTNEENFFNISLEIKKMKNLKESLDKLVQEEIISDYLCDSCKKKCDISKRALLKKLPNMLIVSLKKMCFDLDLCMNIKIHTRYEFPSNVNLKDYMYTGKKKEEGEAARKGSMGDQSPQPEAPQELANDECEYRLVGVVLHKGNAEFGHYTSLINVDRNDPSRPGQTSDGWCEFDDSKVTPFDMSKFEEECFGTNDEKDMFAAEFNPENMISKSAYLLFYEKIKKDPLVMPLTDQTRDQKEFIMKQLVNPSDCQVDDSSLATSYFNLKPYCPEPYKSDIETDNKLLGLEQALLSRNFTTFLAEFVPNIDLAYDSMAPEQEPSEGVVLKRTVAEGMLITLPQVLSKVFFVAYDNFKIKNIVNGVERALNFISYSRRFKPAWEQTGNQKLAGFFTDNLAAKFTEYVNLIVSTNDAPLRNGLIDYVVMVFSVTCEAFEIDSLRSVEHPPVQPPHSDDLVREQFETLKDMIIRQIYDLIKRLVELLLKINVWNAHYKRIAILFGVLKRLCDNNPCITRYLADNDVMSQIYELYLNTDADKLIGMERIMCWLLGLTRVLYDFKMRHTEENEGYEFALQDTPKTSILCKAITEDLREDSHEELRNLVRLFCHNDKLATETFNVACLSNMSTRTETMLIGQLEGLKGLLSITDELQDYRVRLVLGIPKLSEEERQRADVGVLPVYGLGADNNLKSTVVNYVSPCAMKKSVLEWIWICKDNAPRVSLVLIFYLAEIATSYSHVLEYMCQLDPQNYLSATVYDWWEPFVEHHLKTVETNYAVIKTEFETLLATQIMDQIKHFKLKVAALPTAVTDGSREQTIFATGDTPYGDYFSSTRFRIRDQNEKRILSHKPIFIIGDTHAKRAVSKKVLEERGTERLLVKCELVSVDVMPSEPCGQTNQAFFSEDVSANYIVNLANKHEGHAGSTHVGFRVTGQSKKKENSISSLDDDSDDNLAFPAPGNDDGFDNTYEVIQKISQEGKTAEADADKTSKRPPLVPPKRLDFVLRIEILTNIDVSHFVRFRVNWPEKFGNYEDYLIATVKANRLTGTVYTLTLPDLAATFEGARIWVSHKASKNSQQEDLRDDNFSQWQLLFNGKEHA